jgi:hypothetical protein
MKRIKFFQFVFFLFLFILIPCYASSIVEIKGISDNTIPEIIAVVNIINTDLEDHLYEYEYCILSDMLSSCVNSIDRGSGSIFIEATDNRLTELTLNVNEPGEYWFKFNLYQDSEKITDSKFFTAFEEFPEFPKPEALPTTGFALAMENVFSFNIILPIASIFAVLTILSLYKRKKEDKIYREAIENSLFPIMFAKQRRKK